jgi:hypothetical protein
VLKDLAEDEPKKPVLALPAPWAIFSYNQMDI